MDPDISSVKPMGRPGTRTAHGKKYPTQPIHKYGVASARFILQWHQSHNLIVMENKYLEKAQDVGETSISCVDGDQCPSSIGLVDDVFGEITRDSPNYRNVSRPPNNLIASEAHLSSSDGWEPPYLC